MGPGQAVHFGSADASPHQLHGVDHLVQVVLDVLEVLNGNGLCQVEGHAEEEFGLGQVLDGKLVHDLVHAAGFGKQSVGQPRIAVNKNPFPRHLHVVENGHAVHLVQATGERMVEGPPPGRGQGGAADEAQTRGGHRQAEGKGVGLCRLAGLQIRRGKDGNFIGKRGQGGDHTRATDDDAGVGLADDARRRVVGLLVHRPRAVGLRVDQRVGKAEVVLSQELVVLADVAAEGLPVAGKVLVSRGKAGHVDVHEVGAAAHHAAGPVHPRLDHLAPPHQVGRRRRLEVRKRKPLSVLPAVRKARLPLRVVLEGIQLGHRARSTGKPGVGGNISHPLAVNPQLAPIAKRVKVVLCVADTHGAVSPLFFRGNAAADASPAAALPPEGQQAVAH